MGCFASKEAGDNPQGGEQSPEPSGPGRESIELWERSCAQTASASNARHSQHMKLASRPAQVAQPSKDVDRIQSAPKSKRRSSVKASTTQQPGTVGQDDNVSANQTSDKGGDADWVTDGSSDAASTLRGRRTSRLGLSRSEVGPELRGSPAGPRRNSDRTGAAGEKPKQ